MCGDRGFLRSTDVTEDWLQPRQLHCVPGIETCYGTCYQAWFMDLTHQGLSFWALSLLHTNCWPLRGLSLRQGVSWYCVWTSLAPDPVCAWCTLLTELCHRRCLLRSTRPARAGCSTLCLLSAQDSFQLIDFKFFFKKLQTFQNNCAYSIKIFLYSTKEISIIFIGVDYVSTQ